MTQRVEIRRLEDLDCAEQSVGLPVGRRVGRSQEKKEWYVLINFLKAAIPFGMVEVPIAVRNGVPPLEPDFTMSRAGELVGLFEITEATAKADQKEMTAIERSTRKVAMRGEFGGRFKNAASRPGIIWAADIVDAIRRKSGKVIFQDSPAARHLIIYPNSNASALLFGDHDERNAVDDLRAAIAEDIGALSQMTNGCYVHVLGAYLVCLDTLGALEVLTRGFRA